MASTERQLEGPGDGKYNGSNGPSKADLSLPTKIYPYSSTVGKTHEHIIEGPNCEGEKYHKD
jgi:hypothetical protein